MANATKKKSGGKIEESQEPILAEEMEETSINHSFAKCSALKRTNAFAELMSAKKPKAARPVAKTTSQPVGRGFNARNGLGMYIESPEKNPEGLVVEYDDDFVVINDKFPKASVHLLLIPRKPEYYHEHPLHLLSTNPAFLAEVKTRVQRLRVLAASELRRKYGRHSASDSPYQSALEELMSLGDTMPASERDTLLPPGRDWGVDIKVGVHTHPSMNHMHIHILSRDMHSPCLKHKKHYLSFNSSFFVGIEEFPLGEGSERFHPGDWPTWDMKCWRCGENFQNKFARLKGHLGEEFEEWKKR